MPKLVFAMRDIPELVGLDYLPQSIAKLTGTEGLLAPTPIDRFHESLFLIEYHAVRF